MSTRWYPLYQRGNPQLRIFLPNFWLKLVRPHFEQPPNVVQFKCSMEMTKIDIRNYLEKIYGVNVIDVRTRIALGKTKPDPGKGYIVKEDDIKYAYVVLPQDEKFEFPDLCPHDQQEKEMKENEKTVEQAKKEYKGFIMKGKDRPGVPGWFSF